jgi:hypothetical protein
MTTYTLILFLHLVGAFGIIASFGLEWMGLDRLQRTCTVDEVRASLRSMGVIPWIGGPSYLLSLLSGIYLWETSWRGTAWTVIALISLVAIAAIGAVFTGPRMASLSKAIAGEAGTEPIVSRSMQTLWGSLQVRSLMALGITFLMTVKPGLAGSAVVMVFSVVAGLAMNQPMASYYRSHDVCAASRRRE